MGIYMISTKELAEKLDEALDNIEGDFTDGQLQDVLEVLKLYPFVCNVAKSVPKYVKARRQLEKDG
jgi:hypothetical protein